MSVEISFSCFGFYEYFLQLTMFSYAVCASQLIYVGWSYLWWLQVFCWGEEGRKARGTFERLVVLFKVELLCLLELIST